MRIIHIFLLLLLFCASVFAEQVQPTIENDEPQRNHLLYKVEFQADASSAKTPLWLNANRYGLSSLDKRNGYVRAALLKPLEVDSLSKFALGYGVDVALPYHYTSDFVVQQAFVEARWLHGVLSVGSKEYPMELKNNRLSSGSQTLGINARPVPQVRLALHDYWTVPFTKGWLHLKGHVAFGKMTDDNWQKDFTACKKKYVEDVLYHSKAGYLKIGNDDTFSPFSLEFGLEMAAQFGGTSYMPDGEGNMVKLKNKVGLRAFWNAFVPGGADANEKEYKNIEGNQLGSWLIRANWDAELWRLSLYVDKYFEDHSAMFQVDYDGYGKGPDWDVRKKNRYLLYDFKDMLLGMELTVKYGSWIKGLVLEYLYTKYQSGPIYHDHTPGISDHIGGLDNYYNHYIYPGLQHWGQVIGNPLYRSPLYNKNGMIAVEDNRFVAFHLGIEGQPSDRLSYRVLASWQEGLGTYADPYTKKHHNLSLMVEGCYAFEGKWGHGWTVKGAYGMDCGHILGHNYGFQLTLTKTGWLHL